VGLLLEKRSKMVSLFHVWVEQGFSEVFVMMIVELAIRLGIRVKDAKKVVVLYRD
jgi:hypothetical protein